LSELALKPRFYRTDVDNLCDEYNANFGLWLTMLFIENLVIFVVCDVLATKFYIIFLCGRIRFLNLAFILSLSVRLSL